MAIQLEKKKPFDLTKREPGLKRIFAGLGWDVADGHAADCDVSVFMLGENNRIPSEGYFVFYNNLESEDKSVRHSGDNRTGEGDGDDEVVNLDLGAVSSSVVQILFAVTIHDAEEKKQHFGIVQNARIRIVNTVSNIAICEYKLGEQFSDSDSMIIGRLFRDGAEWKFEAMGDAFSGGLGALVGLYT